jgi:hypothetical protein
VIARLALLPLALAGAVLAAKTTPTLSWGKAGVSMADYRADALACGQRGWYTDIADTSQAKAFVQASKQLDTLYDSAAEAAHNGDSQQAGTYYANAAQTVDATRPREKIAELKTVLVDQASACLKQRGYRRFTLTDDQARRLAKLRHGSDERRAYLHDLAADPKVLAAQGL